MIVNNDEKYEIAPGENQLTKSIIIDYHCVVMEFPQFFSSGYF